MEKLLRRFLQHNKLTQCYLFCFLIEFALAISCFFIFKNIYFCIISIIPIVLILFLILNNKIIEEIQIKCARRLSKFDILQKCFLACIFIFAPITIVKHILNNNDFGYVVLIPIFFVFATIETIKQNNNYKKEGKELFGNDYKNKFNTNIEVLKSIIIPLIYPYYVIAILLLVLFAYPLTRKIIEIFITSQLDQKIYINEINNWGEFGDYIGGVFGILLTLFTFAITLYMLYSQQKQIKMAREEFRQQQFETTTFANLLKEIKEHINKIGKDNEVTKQFYQLLQMIFREIHEYSNNKITIKKNIDMLKTYLSKDILIKIFRDKNIPNDSKKDNDDLFVNIRNIINKYALFQNLNLSCNQSDNNCYKKYKISAFENNIELMTYRISLEPNAEELDKDEYVEHSNVAVRQAVAANPNTLEKTLNFLSIDNSKEVRQKVASNKKSTEKILKILANDKEYSVRLSVATNKNLPNELMIKLAEDENIEVRKGIIQRSDCPTGIKIKILKKSNYDDNCCKVVIRDDKTPVTILNKILDKYTIMYIREVMQHEQANKETFEKIIDILDKNLISNKTHNEHPSERIHYQECVDDLLNLLKIEKLYQYENIVKRSIQLYIDHCKRYQDICKMRIIKPTYLHDKTPKNQEDFTLKIILEYVDNRNKSVDDDMFNNIQNFISSRNDKLKNKKEIKEKINNIEENKLNKKQKDALIEALSL